MAINLSLSKLPWYGQVGAFVALSLAAAGVFWNFYARADAGGIDQRSAQLATLRAGIDRGLADRDAAAGVPPRGRAARSAARSPARRAARGAGRRRSAAPRPGDGHAVEPDDPRLHAAGGRAQADARGMADRPAARRHAITTSATFLERVSKFPRIINVGDIKIDARRTPSGGADDHRRLHGDDVRAARSTQPAPAAPAGAGGAERRSDDG